MWPLLLALTTLMPISFCITTAMWGESRTSNSDSAGAVQRRSLGLGSQKIRSNGPQHTSIDQLPAPTNVYIDSYNMKHILKWDPVQVPSTPLSVKYRVECELSGSTRLMCESITETQCDFTNKTRDFWRGRYKVRAELEERRSSWAEASNGEFQASKHTKLGPVQSLVLEPHAGSLIVKFLPPFSPIPNILKIKYWLYYWKKEDAENEKEKVPLEVITHCVLENLEEETMYCVQVKAATDHIHGQMTDPKCAKTMIRDYTGKHLAVIIVCVIVVCLIYSLTGYMLYRHNALLKRILYPPFRMPYHIQQFLENVPDSPCEAAFDPGHKEEQFDAISVIDSTLLLEVNQACAEPNPVSAEKT
ncbi:interferon gamma receptor 2 isoform X2 [Dendropsophus ebraccatus]|uniref:interferon gamma receptor 2 isoform X2 n=1 Tax=Dendropsophus ebraccatus TaxID=150705 RepID=UPI003830FFDF